MTAGRDPETGECLTVLRTVADRFATKRWIWNPTLNEWRLIAYSAGTRFTAEERPIASLHDLAAAVEDVRRDPRALAVRGELTPEVRAAIARNPGASIRRLKHAQAGVAATLVEAPRRQLMLDVDGWPLPDWADLIGDPEAVIEAAITDLLPPPFHDAACFWQLSSSAGFKHGVLRCHLFFWLAEPTCSADLKTYFQVHAPQVDRSVFGAAQPLYIATPVIQGGPDPLPRRTGWRKGLDDAVALPPLDLAALHETIRAKRQRAANGAGIADAMAHGLEGLLALLGDGREGFHVPLRTVAMVYARRTAPQERDDAALKDAVRQAIADAPCAPHRSRGELERYGSDHYLDDLIEGAYRRIADSEAPPQPPVPPHYQAPTGSREAAMAALEREARAFLRDAATALAIRRDWQARRTAIEDAHPPKSRERRAALRTARKAMVETYGRDWQAPGRRLLLPAAAGSGKTALLARLIHEAGSACGRVFFATATLANAVAVAEQIPGAVVVRGRSAPDPDNMDGKTMCWRPEAAQAVARAGLPVGQTLCRDSLGRTCHLYGMCGYQRQAARLRSGEVSVCVGSHEYLTLHAPMPAPDLVIVDETCVASLVGRVELGADRLLPDAMPNWQAAGLQAALDFRAIMVTVGLALRDPAGSLAGLRARGITEPAHLRPAVEYLRSVEDRDFTSGITPATADDDVLDQLDRHQRSEIGAVLKVLIALQAEIAIPRDLAHGVVFHPDKPIVVDGKPERQARIAVHYRKRLAFGADLSVLLLDASGDAAVYGRLFGERLDAATDVRCERNAEVVQVRDVTLPRSALLGANAKGTALSALSAGRAERLRAEVAAVATALATRHGSLMLATNMPVEAALLPDLPEAVTTGHFGALRGRNDFAGCEAGLIVGREQPPPQAMEALARALWAADPEPLRLPGAYEQQTRGIRMRDGSAVPVKVHAHPDARVQRVVELHRERESEQALDRLRLIHNPGAKTVYLACNLPMDVTVDRTVTWNEMVHEITGRMDNGQPGKGRRVYRNRLVEAFQCGGGVLPLSRAILLRLFGPQGTVKPGLWASERAVGDDLKQGADSTIYTSILWSPHLSARIRFRLPGQRGSDCEALVGPPGDAGRAALEALVGPVAFYDPAPREDGFPADDHDADHVADPADEPPEWWDAPPAEAQPPDDAAPPEDQPMPKPKPAPPTWWDADANARHAEAAAILVAYALPVPPPDDLEDAGSHFTCVMPDADDPLPAVMLVTPRLRVERRQAFAATGVRP